MDLFSNLFLDDKKTSKHNTQEAVTQEIIHFITITMKLITKVTFLVSMLYISTGFTGAASGNDITKREDSRGYTLCYEHNLQGWCWLQRVENRVCTHITEHATMNFGSITGETGAVCRIHRTTDCDPTKDTMVCHHMELCNMYKEWSHTAKAMECSW